MKALDQKAEKDQSLNNSRQKCRKTDGRLNWVQGHLAITQIYSLNRVPFPEKGEHAERRGRKATGQSWSLIAGLPKELSFKGQRSCQDVRAY